MTLRAIAIKTLRRGKTRSSLVYTGLTALTILLFCAVTGPLISWDAVKVLASATVLFALLLATRARTQGQTRPRANDYFAPALLIWWSLIACGALFRRGETDWSAFEESSSLAAYQEGVFWLLAALVLLFISLIRPSHLRGVFSGCQRWISLFALVSLLSAAYSPRPFYSLAWAFKLALVALVARMSTAGIRDLKDLGTFWRVTLWGFICITVEPLIRALTHPSIAFKAGRLNEAIASPTALSETAGVVLLLSLMLRSMDRRAWPLGFAVFGLVAMVASGGKTGIAAGVISATVFFMLQRRLASGLGLLCGALVVGCIAFVVTPVHDYVTFYARSGDIETLTGRTELWSAALPSIMARPIWGHGYVASRFVAGQVEGIFRAGHMHNRFLEVLYNNGITGLGLIAAVMCATARNLWYVIRVRPSGTYLVVAVGSMAIYVNLLLVSLFEATLGGQAEPLFMLFLALAGISEVLPKMVDAKLAGRQRPVGPSASFD